MKIIHPPKLNIGDTIGIVSPSAPVTYKGYYRRSVRALEKLGFKVILGKNALRSLGYMAGTSEERLSDLHEMISNPQIKAIFASAGGFAAQHLLRRLDYNLIKKNPKIICGFSDVAVLLNAIFQKTGLITFYSFPIELLSKNLSSFTVKSFMEMVASNTPFSLLPQKSRWHIFHKGRAKGRLIGGNLLTFVNALSSETYAPDLRQRSKFILFLEEHGVDLEELDNSLHRLGLAGVFECLEGIIIGKIVGMGQPGQSLPIPTGDPEYKLRPRSLTVNQIFKRIFREYKVFLPIVSNVDFGYVSNKITLPIGARISLNLNKSEPEIKLLENPVSPS